MHRRLLLYGIAIRVAGTLALRVAGERLLRPDHWVITLIVFAVSFPLMAWLVRRLCKRFVSRREEWPAGAVSVVLPTLLLDPFSSTFFPVVFPNIAPQMAGVFGGWMLWCCAGALVGVTVGCRRVL